MLQYVKSFGLALLLSVGAVTVAKSASFDCNKATTETEIAICADPELSALDELISISYSVARSIPLNKDSLRNTQGAPSSTLAQSAGRHRIKTEG